MDEEVILESSPFYQHLKGLQDESFEISTIEVTNDCAPDLADNHTCAIYDHDQQNIYASNDMQWYHKLLGTQSESDSLKRSIVEDLLGCSCLMEEHYNVLAAYIESFHDVKPPDKVSRSTYWRYAFVSGAACLVCMTKSSLSMTLTTLTGVLAGFGLPSVRGLINRTLVKSLYQERARIGDILKTFTDSTALWKSVQQFCKEVQLIYLGTSIGRKDRQGFSVTTANGATRPVRQCAQLFLVQSIESIQNDISYLASLIDKSVVHQLGLSVTQPQPLANLWDINSLQPTPINCVYEPSSSSIRVDIVQGYGVINCCYVGDVFQSNHKILVVKVSQWIFYLVIVILTNRRPSLELANQLSKLKAFPYPQQLHNTLKFRKMVLDGELEPKIQHTGNKLRSDKEQAAHSLYLHSRELLRLAKLAEHGDASMEELHSNISQQIADCASCLELACKKRKLPVDNQQYKDAEISQNDTRIIPITDYDEPVIDQVFTATGSDEELSDDGMDLDEVDMQEIQLRKQYETFLMRELKGVIHELAKERVSRESQLSQTDGKSLEQIAKITQQIVENRDIKGLIKSAAEHDMDNDEPSIGLARGKYWTSKYEQNTDYTSQQPIPLDLAQIASRAASNYVQQENDVTFGSDDSDDEPTGDQIIS